MRIDIGGKSHQIAGMATLILEPEKQKRGAAVVGHYDIAADAKNRISLRGAKTKYFHVKAFSNGCYVLVPRLLVAPPGLSTRSLKMLDKSVAQLKKGRASAPISDKGDITVLAIEPHPEDQKRGAYQRIKLSALPASKLKPRGKERKS
jgi:hypothetical protein